MAIESTVAVVPNLIAAPDAYAPNTYSPIADPQYAEAQLIGAPIASPPIALVPVEEPRLLPEDVALVHDYLLTPRGAERTFEAIARDWRGSQIYTSLFDEAGMGRHFEGHEVTTSGLQRFGARQDRFRTLLPFFPGAVERLPVGREKLVISSSSAFAHGVRPAPGATHVCYCHSPFRYAWHENETALRELPKPLRPALRQVLENIRRWDIKASRRVTHYVANSEITQQRIADFYGRDSTIIHPPVDVDRFGPPVEPEDYILYVGEVTGHKRVEIAIQAAKLAGRRLKIVGDGPNRARLQALFPTNVEFVGRLSDEDLADAFARAQALIVPNVEEFGIAAVEAQAAGRPVLATAKGGTRETVIDGVTGVLVPNGTVDEFAEALANTDFTRFDGADIATYASRFSHERFRLNFDAFARRASGADACESSY